MDQLARLPEEDALRAYSDGLNRQALFRLILALVIALVAIALEALFLGLYEHLILPACNLLALRWLYLSREKAWFERRFRTVLIVWLSLQLMLLRSVFLEPRQSFHWLDWLLPTLVLLFHLPASRALIPLASLWALASGRHLLLSALDLEALDFTSLIGHGALIIVILSVVSSLRLRREHRFLALWRDGHRRHRERLRLREELDAARQIQLGMLPKGDPNLPWLEVASRSIPASEVGGDYYDYLPMSADESVPPPALDVGWEGRPDEATPTRLAVVIGDVSGHGVASGLLLSGIRSCLYLLQETPLPPAEILAKLDRMVRKTTGRRVLVTMIYAVFDQQQQQLTFSSAAHPPVVRYAAAADRVEELGLEALPLGTRIGSTLREKRVGFQPGDLFVFATDGIAEVPDSAGGFYGTERLQRCLYQARKQSARQVRDAILNDLWSFKGDRPQPDDITLVVVKVR